MMQPDAVSSAAELANLWCFYCKRTKFGICRDHPTDVKNEMESLLELGFSADELKTAILDRRDRFEQLWQFHERMKLSKFGKNGTPQPVKPSFEQMLADARKRMQGGQR